MRSPKGYVVTPKVNAKMHISRLVYDFLAFSCLSYQVYDLLGLLERHALGKEKGVGDAGLCLLIYMMSNGQWEKFFLQIALLKSYGFEYSWLTGLYVFIAMIVS
ncbi:hypothetical protein KBY71_04040 [Cyanobium sp. T1B-Tous]|nr:hypothetical protein [Cyanobium sp. T1B-Tous]